MDPPDDMEITADGSSSTDPHGGKVDRSRATARALERRRRAATMQKYAQQVPPEFRRQVAEYFEVISE
jgi:hypothetical protein